MFKVDDYVKIINSDMVGRILSVIDSEIEPTYIVYFKKLKGNKAVIMSGHNLAKIDYVNCDVVFENYGEYITECWHNLWQCYGKNLVFTIEINSVNIDFVINLDKDEIIESTIYCDDSTYRWIHPDYASAVKDEYTKRNVKDDAIDIQSFACYLTRVRTLTEV